MKNVILSRNKILPKLNPCSSITMGKIIGGGILLFFGLFMIAGFAISTSEGAKPVTVGDVVLVVIVGIIPVVGGSLLLRSYFKGQQQARLAKEKELYKVREKEVIRLAQKTDGRVTIPEIVAETSMSTLEADQLMREMAGKGYVEMNVTDSGVVIYEFYELASRKDAEQ